MITERLLKQVVIISLIVVLGFVIFIRLYTFVPSLLGAVTVFIISRPFFHYLLSIKLHKTIAAFIILLITLAAVVLPIFTVVTMLSGKVSNVMDHSQEYFEGLTHLGLKIKDLVGVDILSADTINELKTLLSNALPKVLNFTVSIITSLGMTLFLLFFLLINTINIEKIVSEYLPLKPENLLLIKKEIKSAVLTNAIMIPLIAILQSVIAFFGYLIFGVPDPLFWAVITAFACIIPLVGSALIWLPLGIYLLTQQHTSAGVGLMLYSTIVIGAADNLFRILIQSRIGDTHPLITIFGIIIGVPLFGFIGLIFGPIIISIFLLLLKIYKYEFFELDKT
jgi:predicted PurR-regulated permease PerM